ncbi:MAG: FecR domain-containing protein [Bacteroidales bacterium]|nr:FecR domain-containing protein [Bacteroidales bacterium]
MYSANDKYEALIMSYLDGQCSAEEAHKLLLWVAESEENRLYFNSLKDQYEVWNLTDFAMPEFDEADVEAALDAINAKIDAIEETETKVVQMPWLRRNYKYVSGVAAALIIALFVGFLVRNPFNSTVTYAYNGQNESSYTLPDGTSVNFNSEGTLSHPKHFAKSERSVNFEGVAYFDVAKDEAHPFVLHCNNMDVEVLGTSFLLNAGKNAERYTVDLYTGKVKMTSFDEKGNILSVVEINPGERGVWNATESELKTMSYSEVKEDELLTNHVLVFDNEKLSKIVEALEYIYKVEINLSESCASKKLTARFSDDESIDEVLETIAVVTEVTVTKEGEIYQIR